MRSTMNGIAQFAGVSIASVGTSSVKPLALPGNIYMHPSDGYALSLELAEN